MTSAIRRNPFLPFTAEPISKSRGISFDDFFSSSRVGIPNRSIPSQGSSRTSFRESSRSRPKPNPTITSRGAPASDIRQSTSSPARKFAPQLKTAIPTPRTREQSRKTLTPINVEKKVSASRDRQSEDRRLTKKTADGSVRSNPELSSRGRVQEEPIVPAVTRPHTTTESNVPDVVCHFATVHTSY